MDRRLEFQELLKGLLGSNKVYFQPPANVHMEYPCIVYHRDRRDYLYAGNNPYHHSKRYMVTVIDRNPDSMIPDKVAELPLCSYSRFYTADNLNHDVFNVFY